MSKKTEKQLFEIPDSFFDRLYEFTGSNEELRGFVLVYISSDNTPMIKSICRNPTVETALYKTMDDFVKNQKVSMQDVRSFEEEETIG